MTEYLNVLRNRLGTLVLRTGFRLLEDSERRRWRQIVDVRSTSIADSLRGLKARGLSPQVAVDIGAHVGGWTPLFKSVFPDTRILMVEPQPRHSEVLTRLAAQFGSTVTFAATLLGSKITDSVPFFVLDDGLGGGGSSVLPENSNVPRHTVRLPMTTLDALIAELRFPAPDFLKLDVQGFELEVLKGSTAVLGQVQCLLLEVSVWQYNTGSPLFDEVITWIASAGFVAYDLCGISRRSDGVLLQLDILFIRKDSELLKSAKTIYPHWPSDADRGE